jgi:hypothetical protein
VAWRFGSQVLASDVGHLAIVVVLRAAVNRVFACESADVSGEFWADVIELVNDGDQFFVEGLVEESGQVEGKDVLDFCLVDEDLLHFVTVPSANLGEFATTKSKRNQASLQAPGSFVSAPNESDEDLRGLDVREHGESGADVGAQEAHSVREVKRPVIGKVGANKDAAVAGRLDWYHAASGWIAKGFVCPTENGLDSWMFKSHCKTSANQIAVPAIRMVGH